MAEQENVMNVTFDMNEFMKAYRKEDFMKGVFVNFLKQNESIVASAIGDYVLRDLVKSNFIDEITEQVKTYVMETLKEENLSKYNNPVKNEIHKVSVESVLKNSHQIDLLINRAINSEGTKKKIIDTAKAVVKSKVAAGFSNFRDEDGYEEEV